MSALFPETFVINSDHRMDRWSEMIGRCKTCGLNVTRVPAIIDNPGWRGCGRSHISCIEIAKAKGLPWILIMEDDAIFTVESIARFRSLLSYLWSNRDKWERFNGGPTITKKSVMSVMDYTHRLLYVRGLTSHFHLIHAGVYDLLLAWHPDRDLMIDKMFFELETRFRTVFNNIATVPHIAVQSSSSASDIQRKIVDYSAMFAWSEHKMRECLNGQDSESSASILARMNLKWRRTSRLAKLPD